MDGALPPLVPGWASRSVESTDAEAILREFHSWDMRWLQLSPSRGTHRVIAGFLGEVRFVTTSASGSFHLQGASPVGFLTVQFDLGSDTDRVVGGRAVGADDLLVATRNAEFGLRSAARHQGMNFSLSAATVAAALDRRAPGMPDLQRASRLGIVSPQRSLVGRIRRLADAVLGLAQDGSGSPQLAALSSCDVIDTVVAALLAPWHRDSAATYREASYQRLPVVRRAEDFMRANLGEAVMLHDICRAARASERTVEYAFRDVYGVGAKQYLKLLRLDRVRRQLQRAEPRSTTVQAAAQQAGLWHMGHFSTTYHRLFGETPGDTLAGRATVQSTALRSATAASLLPGKSPATGASGSAPKLSR